MKITSACVNAHLIVEDKFTGNNLRLAPIYTGEGNFLTHLLLATYTTFKIKFVDNISELHK
jgi:hypothetical protein